MEINDKMKHELHQIFHNSQQSPEQIADGIGAGYNHLCRSLLNGNSGCNFSLWWLYPLMSFTNSYSPLKTLAHGSGFLLVKNPRVSASIRELKLSITLFQTGFAKAVQMLLSCLNEPTPTNKAAALETLTDHIELAERFRRQLKTNSVNQIEMEF